MEPLQSDEVPPEETEAHPEEALVEPVTALGVWALTLEALRAQPLTYLGLASIWIVVRYTIAVAWAGRDAATFPLVTLVLLGAFAFTQMSIASGVVSYLAGSPLTASSMLIASVRYLPTAGVAYLIAMIYVCFASLFLLVPGIIVAVSLTPLAAVAVSEGCGPIRTLRRTMDLTKGRLWAMFRIWLLYGLVSTVVLFVVGVAAAIVFESGVNGGSSSALIVFDIAVRVGLMVVSSALAGGAYHALKGTPRLPLPTRF